MAKKSSAGPLLALAALGGGLALVFSKKASALEPGSPAAASTPTLPATPAPPGVQSVPVTINGHPWKLVPITGQPIATVDVYAPAGSWGPHGELRVCRFTQLTPESRRQLAGVASGVPAAVLAAALKDLAIATPAVSPVATSKTPAGSPPMPASLQQEIVSVMTELGVDAGGVVRGPVTAAGIQHATELSSRLERAGYPDAAAALRGYAQQASKMLPPPAAPSVPAIPGVPPAMAAAIDRALQLERDPAKLEALRNSLQSLPASPERDLLIGALDALILQVRTAQVISQTATEIDQMQTATPLPGPAPLAPERILKLVSPYMRGADVQQWQQVLRASGYTVTADGVFGPATDAATKDWQKKRGLTPDGDVGPQTRAKIGTAPTAPLAVPASASPRPDPPPKGALEVAAESLATHLLALQKKYGVAASKGRQDVTLVKRFQTLAGGTADGLPGVNTILSIARSGVGVLPAVMYWPKNGTKSSTLPAFRTQLKNIAASARSAGKATLAAQIEASAARETGAGGLK